MVILTDTIPNFAGRQLPRRLNDRFLAVLPLRLDRVQPRTLDRQATRQDAHSPLLLGSPVVLLDPTPHSPTDVPRGVVPDHQKRFLALGCQPLTGPRQELLGHLADRPTRD